MTDASKSYRRCGQVADFAIGQEHVSPGGAPCTGEGLDQLALPVAFDSGDAEDLALVQLEGDTA